MTRIVIPDLELDAAARRWRALPGGRRRLGALALLALVALPAAGAAAPFRFIDVASERGAWQDAVTARSPVRVVELSHRLQPAAAHLGAVALVEACDGLASSAHDRPWSEVELKVDEFRHEHLGQLNTYVNWFRQHEMTASDNPPVGLLLCTRKSHALLEYALAGLDNQLFVSKYQLALPSKEDMQHFLEREIVESGYPEDDTTTGRLVREMRERYAAGKEAE